MSIASNASPLIYLATIKKLDILKKLFGEVSVSGEVFREAVLSGKDEGAPDAFLIDKAIKKGWIRKVGVTKIPREVKDVSKRLGLHKGEIEAISLALAREAKNILIDEDAARSVARIFDLTPIGTIGALLKAYNEELLSNKELREAIMKLMRTKARISTEVYARALEAAKKEKTTE